jgi:ribosomal protein S12 methylthiotransferase accessory factor
VDAVGITRVANVTGLDRIGIPVVMVVRPVSRTLSVSQGKGLTLAAAKVSGLMEAIELHHAEQIERPLLLGTYNQLRRRHQIVGIEQLPRVRGKRFHGDLQTLWIEGYDLLQHESVWIPFECAHISDVVPAPTGSGYFAANSNGLASGNNIYEALLHGLLEVVERDATSIWEASRRAGRMQRLVLPSVTDDTTRDLLDRFENAGFDVVVWNTTTDVGLPSFLALIADRRDSPAPSFAAGMGCHTNREIALQRALTEAAQSRLTVIAASRDDLSAEEYLSAGTTQRTLGIYREAKEQERSEIHLQSIPTFDSDDIVSDLDQCLIKLRAAGVDHVVAIDLTKDDLGISVARVVIPSLEGIDDDRAYEPGPRARRAGGDAS